jgi:threonine dehydrogenase-like Zn-dependent dehydrogenase
MKSKVMIQVDDRRIEGDEVEIPRVGAGNALLRVHEPVGIIEELGAEAAQAWGVTVGDRVALEPHLTCGRCDLCLSGRYHICKSVRDQGLPAYGYLPLDYGHGLWGGYSQYIHLHPRTIMHRIPDSVPLDLATMYQALAAGVRWAVHIPKTAIGDTVLILGCGQRGLGSIVACREAGAAKIIITGLAKDRRKLALAKALGANHTIVNIDTDQILFKELEIRGAYSQGSEAYQESLRLLSENKYDFARMKTHRFPLAEAEQAILTLAGEVEGEEAVCVSLNPVH